MVVVRDSHDACEGQTALEGSDLRTDDYLIHRGLGCACLRSGGCLPAEIVRKAVNRENRDGNSDMPFVYPRL